MSLHVQFRPPYPPRFASVARQLPVALQIIIIHATDPTGISDVSQASVKFANTYTNSRLVTAWAGVAPPGKEGSGRTVELSTRGSGLIRARVASLFMAITLSTDLPHVMSVINNLHTTKLKTND